MAPEGTVVVEMGSGRELQLQAQAELVEHSRRTSIVSAFIQNMVSVGVGAATTFGLGRTSGHEWVADSIAQMLKSGGTDLQVGRSAALQATGGILAGGAMGAVGHLAAQLLLIPACQAVVQAFCGAKVTVQRVEVEHLYPDPLNPVQREAVDRLRSEARRLQDSFGVDRWRSIGVGSLAFGLAHGARASSFELNKAARSIIERVGLSTAASGTAGAATGAAMALWPLLQTVPVRIGETSHALPLFKAHIEEVNVTQVLDRVAQEVTTAAKKFNGQKLKGIDLAGYALVQIFLRAGALVAATAAMPVLRVGTGAAISRLRENANARAAVAGGGTAAEFVCVVTIWFTLAAVIARSQQGNLLGTNSSRSS